jgi:hypothetical protein
MILYLESPLAAGSLSPKPNQNLVRNGSDFRGFMCAIACYDAWHHAIVVSKLAKFTAQRAATDKNSAEAMMSR